LVTAALLAELRDLLDEILRARPTTCRPVLDVAMVEPFKVFVQSLVGYANVIVNRLWQRQKLAPPESGDVSHARF
jgi:hypothetical protein